MKISLTEKQLLTYLSKQLNYLFPDKRPVTQERLSPFLKETLIRLEYTLSKTRNPHFHEGKDIIFNHLYSDQYASFLYFYSNTAWKRGKDKEIPSKIYCLNKALNAIDVYYEIALPDIFYLGHATGTVIGRATLKNYLVVYQNCTIGANRDTYPIFGEGVVLYAGASAIGKTEIGNNCHISAQTCIIDSNIPSNSIVFGSFPHYKTKKPRENVIDKFFLR
jgi:serine O-acetyltransferase